VFLLPTSNPSKFLLRHTRHEPLQPSNDFLDALAIQRRALRPAYQRLDLYQTVAVQMLPEALVHFLRHGAEKSVRVADVEDFVDETCLNQLGACDALTHYQRFVCFADAEALHECYACVSFCHETERGKGREEVGGWRGVYKVAEGDQCGGETDGWAVEGCDEDFWVCVEGVGYVEVVCDEGFEERVARVEGGGVGGAEGGGDVCAAG